MKIFGLVSVYDTEKPESDSVEVTQTVDSEVSFDCDEIEVSFMMDKKSISISLGLKDVIKLVMDEYLREHSPSSLEK